jgi:hypothetical protein
VVHDAGLRAPKGLGHAEGIDEQFGLQIAAHRPAAALAA